MDATEIAKANLFPEWEDWSSFTELMNAKPHLVYTWWKQATTALRKEYFSSSHEGWSLQPWGDHNLDTKFYLTEYGEDSIFLAFGWRYNFYLFLDTAGQERYDTNQITEALKRDEFAILLEAFNPVETLFDPRQKAGVVLNFDINGVNLSELHKDDVAWYAGNQTDQFVGECMKLIESFTYNSKITEALKALHDHVRIE